MRKTTGLIIYNDYRSFNYYFRKSINVPLLYLKRYIRITIPLAAAILFIMTFFYYMSNGPLWQKMIRHAALDNCEAWWWTTLLYIGNYANPEKLCFGHSWYLLVDMQLYILSPLILYPLWKFKKNFKTAILTIFFISNSSVIYMYLTYYKKEFRISSMFAGVNERDSLTYYATQSRIDSWMTGIFTGYIICRFEEKVIEFSKPFLMIAWIFSAIAIFGIILGQYPLHQANFYENSLHADAAYSAFQRIFWCLAVSWIIIACQQNYGGILQKFLSLSIWLPVSKLSYCIYLMHLPIQLIFLSSIKMPQYFTEWKTLHKFFGDFTLAAFVALVWALLFEYPVLRFIKIMLVAYNKRGKVDHNDV